MLDLEEGLEGRCRLSSGGGRGCGALHREISLIVRLCVVRPRANKIALLLLTIEEIFVDPLRWRVVLFVRERCRRVTCRQF